MSIFETLAGAAGAGLTTYGTILKDKEKQDWEMKKDDLAYKRQQALDDLRNQRAVQAQKVQNEFTVGRDESSQVFQAAQNDNNNNLATQRLELGQKYALQNQAQSAANARANTEFANKLQIDNLGKAEKAQMDLRTKAWDQFVQEGGTKGWDEGKIATVKAAMKFGITIPKGADLTPTDEDRKNAMVIAQSGKNWEKSTEQQKTAAVQEITRGLMLQRVSAEQGASPEGGGMEQPSPEQGVLNQVTKPSVNPAPSTSQGFDYSTDVKQLAKYKAEMNSGDPRAKKEYTSAMEHLQNTMSFKEFNALQKMIDKKIPTLEKAPASSSQSMLESFGVTPSTYK